MPNPLAAVRAAKAKIAKAGTVEAARPPGSPPVADLVVESLEGVQPLAVRYLVPGRVPAGMLGMIAGEGGHGKSMTTLELAAAVTAGRCAFGLTYPDPPHGKALLVSCEDDWQRTIVPRLAALGADLSRVLRVKGVRYQADGQTLDFHLGHYAELRRLLLVHTDIRLVTIDPAGAYVGRAGVNEHKDADLRAVLGPLSEVANDSGATAILVKHLNKSAGASAVQRVSGSAGYVNAVRYAYMIAPDPEDPERKLMLPMKANVLPPGTPGLAYRLAQIPPLEARGILLTRWPDIEVEELDGLAGQLFRQEWEDGVMTDANDVVRGTTRGGPKRADVQGCADFIRRFLGACSWPEAEVEAAVSAAGFSGREYKLTKAQMRKPGRTDPTRLSSLPRGYQEAWWLWIGPQGSPNPDRPEPHSTDSATHSPV